MDNEQDVQVVLVEVAANNVDPGRWAELLTRAGYVVKKVEAESGGTWTVDS